jgi:Fe-Mn family superoxide dismutase
MFNYPYSLPKLNFAYNALEPFIDALTMEIHHTKHHQTYIDKLNKALEAHADLQLKDLMELISNIPTLPNEIQNAVRNNGGGHLNHMFFWDILSPAKTDPSEKLMDVINKSFGSFDEMKTKFSEAGFNRFGSGWAWIVKKADGTLEITSTANQDNPIMEGKNAVLGLDVWEHAYYLKYQNKRAEYINNFWNIIDWQKVESFYNYYK